MHTMRARIFSLLAFTLFTGLAAHAADRLPMTLTPAPDVRAHVEKKGGRYNLIQPQGQRTALATDDDMLDGGEPRFKQEDYNADGFADLAVGIPAGPVDVSYALYIYDPKSTSYKRFKLPAAVSEKQNCDGFWNITLTPQRKAVRSECRGARVNITMCCSSSLTVQCGSRSNLVHPKLRPIGQRSRCPREQ